MPLWARTAASDSEPPRLLAAAACLPTQLWLHHGDVAPLFPPMLAVIGAVMFAQGATFWGRMYLIGTLMLVAVALMPLEDADDDRTLPVELVWKRTTLAAGPNGPPW